MSFLQIAVSFLFVIGYVMITFEHKLKLPKYISSIALAGILWTIITASGFHADHLKETIHELGSEVFALVIFLLSAMVLVEILVHYRLFDLLRFKLLKLKLNDYKQLWFVLFSTFFLSAILDNLTTTLCMIPFASRFFKGNNLVIAGAGIVIAANAGGAFSPIGDVTTIMLWLAGKFSWDQIILQGFLPSLGLFVVSTYMLARNIKSDTIDVSEEKIEFTRTEKLVVAGTLLTFIMPVMYHQIGLEPYFGLLTGLGIMGVVLSLCKAVSSADTHLTADIDKLLQKADFRSLLFFVGILLSVGALGFVGILSLLQEGIYGANPGVSKFVIGNTILGFLSAVLDNIPLTAGAIDILKTDDPSIWVLLALTVGTGGSLLVIGSAAGVVSMEKFKEMNVNFDSVTYFKTATLPATAGYLTAIGIWYIQYSITH